MIPDLIGLKAKLIAGGIILAVILAVFGAQEWRISGLEDQITAKDATISTLTGDLAVAQANVATLTVTIDRQNTAVEALKAQKDALDAKVRESALAARKNRAQSVSIKDTGVDAMNKFFEGLFK